MNRRTGLSPLRMSRGNRQGMERAAERRCRPSHGRFLPIHSRIPFRGAWESRCCARAAVPCLGRHGARRSGRAGSAARGGSGGPICQWPKTRQPTKEESPAEEGQKPADGRARAGRIAPEPKSERQLAPPLAITGLGALEILARDYEEACATISSSRLPRGGCVWRRGGTPVHACFGSGAHHRERAAGQGDPAKTPAVAGDLPNPS